MKTIKSLIFEKIKSVGTAEAAKHYGVSEATVKRWIDPNKPGNPSFEVAEQAFREYVDEAAKSRDLEIGLIGQQQFIPHDETSLKPADSEDTVSQQDDPDDLGLEVVSDESLKAALEERERKRLGIGKHRANNPALKQGHGGIVNVGNSPGVNPMGGGPQKVLTLEEYERLKRESSRAFIQSQAPRQNKIPVSSTPKGDRDTMILFPCERMIHQGVAVGILARLRDQNRHRFEHVSMHFLPDARNYLVEKFLASNCEWSFWVDSDMILPSGPGHANWFIKATGATMIPRRFAEIHAIDQLKSRGHTLIGGVYSPRQMGKRPLIASHEPVSTAGPSDKVEPVNWLATGCMLVHRSVYEDIGKGGWFDLDRKLTKGGEDIAFCIRAKQAGHQPMLDLSVFCGHVGPFVFLPEHCDDSAKSINV